MDENEANTENSSTSGKDALAGSCKSSLNDSRTCEKIDTRLTQGRSLPVRNIDRISLERLREVLGYDPATGRLTWRRRAGRCEAGDQAGSIGQDGYRRIRIDKISHMASHLAWFHFHGVRAPQEIDHKNRDRADDRLENLREATHSENARNKSCRADSASGLKGAVRINDRYRATITINGKRKFLGMFDTAEEAHEAYREAADLHGEFANVPTPETPMVSLEAFNARRELINKRNAATDPIKREQLGILIEQMTEMDRAEPARKAMLAKKMTDQMQLIQRG